MTPQDLKQIGILIKDNFKDIKSDIAVLKDQNNRTEKHIQSIEDHLIKWKSELFDIVDGLAGETRDNREFRTIGSHQIKSHTSRIGKLEKKVFGSVSTV